MKHLQRFALCLVVLLIALTTRSAFAQATPAPVAVITATSMTIATFAFLVAFVVNAYNTGKVFGAIVVPQTWLPYFGVGLPFITAVYASISSVSMLTPVAIFNAVQAGLFALLASAGGASAHIAMAQHFQAPHAVKMARLRSDVMSAVVSASIPPAAAAAAPSSTVGSAIPTLPPTTHTKNILPLLCFAGVLSLATVVACTKAQGTAIGVAVSDTAVCVLTHYSDPPEKIVQECDGATVADVNKILDAATAMAQRKAAHLESVQP